ncbi:hypothetical protein CZP2022_218 [Vibrio phage C-ZP2022]|nr:hypothetical protein CZP2022_218 [Vibrio phage C-ZP2022]
MIQSLESLESTKDINNHDSSLTGEIFKNHFYEKNNHALSRVIIFIFIFR